MGEDLPGGAAVNPGGVQQFGGNCLERAPENEDRDRQREADVGTYKGP